MGAGPGGIGLRPPVVAAAQPGDEVRFATSGEPRPGPPAFSPASHRTGPPAAGRALQHAPPPQAGGAPEARGGDRLDFDGQ